MLFYYLPLITLILTLCVCVCGHCLRKPRTITQMSSFLEAHRQEGNTITNTTLDLQTQTQTLNFPMDSHSLQQFMDTTSPHSHNTTSTLTPTAASATSSAAATTTTTTSRYENQKRRDWNTFGQYLKNHRPPLSLSRCSGAHVLEFLRYLDQFGKTKVHTPICPFYGHPNPPAPCPCPLRQAWGSLDALIGRLRAAFEENGGKPEANPFGARAVRLYLREVRDLQSKARGISYEKKKRKRLPQQQQQQRPSISMLPPPGATATQ